MPTARHHVLVRTFIEKVSGDIFDDRYRAQLAGVIQGNAGIYALYRGDTLYYVGLATDLMRRVDRHLNDHHAGAWDRFSVYLTEQDEHIKPLESLLLRVFRPPGNAQGGKLPGATDGKRALEAAMRRRDTQVRNVRLYEDGSPPVRRRADAPRAAPARKAPAPRAKPAGTLPAAGPKPAARSFTLQRAMPLQAQYKGQPYRATLNKDGSVRLGGERHASLSAAASSITGSPTNGWRFWSARDASGEWVALDRFRR